MEQFVSLFSKHTPFSTQTINCSFDRDPHIQYKTGNGTVLELTVPRHGDLIKSINLKFGFTSPDITDGTTVYFIPPMYMFDRFELVIGDTVVETLYPEMINIYFKVFQKFSKLKGTTYLFGSTQINNDTQSNLPDDNNTVPEFSNRHYYLPLPFYFYNNLKQSLPLCSITKQEVVIRCHMKGMYDCALFTLFTGSVLETINNIKFTECSMDIEYVYLSPQELRFFMSNELHYVITQSQLDQAVVTPVQNQEHSLTRRLEFRNQIVELFMYVLPDVVFSDNVRTVGRCNYVDKNDSGNPDAHSILKVNLECDNQIIMDDDVCNYTFLNNIQYLLNHSSVFEHDYLYNDSFVYNYSFALEPENILPTGSLNFSVLQNKNLKVTFPVSTNTSNKRLFVLARSLNFVRIHDGMYEVLFKNNFS